MEKKYSRRLQSVVGGLLLKEFDKKCANNEIGEAEGIREAIRKYVDYDNLNRERRTPQPPSREQP